MAQKLIATSTVGTAQEFLEQAGELPQPLARADTWWNNLFYGCAACVGGGAMGHLGCLVTPILTLATSGSTAFPTHSPALMIGTAFALNAVTLGTWYKVRGRYVTRPIQAATIGLAALGMAVTTGFNLRTHHHDHNRETAEAYFQSQSPQNQEQIRQNAASLHMDVDGYLTTFGICTSGTPQTRQKPLRTPTP